MSATDIEFDDPESSQDYLAYLASSRFEAAPVPYEQFREEWLAFLAVSGLQKEYLAKQNQVTREVSAFAASTADLTPINIGRYVRSLESRQLRRASIVTMLACLHSACSFAINRRYIAAGNPVDAKTSLLGWVRRGYSGRPAPDSHSTLEDAMVAELLSHLHRRSDSWEGHRLYALVATGLCTGFRRTALLTIRLEDVDLAAGVIRTSAKPFRIFDDQFRAVLSAWSPRSGCEWLFPGVKKMGAWTGGVVSDRAVDRLKAAGQAIGLKRVTFESLRSYYMLHGTRFMPSLMPPAQPATERIGDPCGPSPADRTRAALEVELGKLTPKRSKVVRFLINKGESGATGAVIISATGVPGFRQMLVTLAETSSYWNLRIRFPPDGRTNYVINIF